MSKRRVVITGLGTVNPLATDTAATWTAIQAGKSGISRVEHFDADAYATQIAGTVKDFDVTSVMSEKDARKVDPFIQYAMVAAEQAIDDAGIKGNADPDRVGIAVGSGIGGLTTIEANHKQLLKSGPRRVSPFLVPGAVINMASGNLAIRHGFRGPNIAIVTACTTGTHNIGYAARTIAYGDADVMIAGGTEKGSSELGMAGFAAARAMSTRNDEPEKASRPWDKDRDGFVLGDGAAVLVLESLEHAKARGATIYAEVCGLGMSDDAHHITSPPESGEGARKSMANAIRDAGLTPADIDYINAHGTSTPVGDVAELKAVREVFGDSTPAMSSTKSLTGHSLGATGVQEAIYSLLMMRDGFLAESANINEIVEESEGMNILTKRHDGSSTRVMSNSFGFGGTNCCLVFDKYTE